MKLVLISDTHEQHRSLNVPDGDILIFAGDMSHRGEKASILDFNNWLSSLTHRHKIVIAGNHDFCFERNPQSREWISNATYLEDSGVEIEGLRFWGTPVTPPFMNWAFMRDREEMARHLAMIPDNTDVLITHGPPNRILDQPLVSPRSPYCGCSQLLVRVMDIKPKLHVFGHIHGGSGIRESDGTTFVNASVLNEAYRLTNSPRVFEL